MMRGSTCTACLPHLTRSAEPARRAEPPTAPSFRFLPPRGAAIIDCIRSGDKVVRGIAGTFEITERQNRGHKSWVCVPGFPHPACRSRLPAGRLRQAGAAGRRWGFIDERQDLAAASDGPLQNGPALRADLRLAPNTADAELIARLQVESPGD